MTVLPVLALLVIADRPRALSIEDVLAIAEDRSGAVDLAEAGVRRADADALSAWSEFYPQANASLSYTRTLQSEFDDLFPEDVGAEGPAAGFAELPFGRNNNWRPGLSVTQNLFAGGASLARLSVARANRGIAGIAVEVSAAQAMLEAVQAYYDAVLARRLLHIAEQSLRQAELTLEQTRLGVNNGTMPDFDLLRAQVTYENLRPTFLQRSLDLEVTQLRLKQVLDLPFDQGLVLTTTLDGEIADITPAVRAASGLFVVQEAEGPGEEIVRAPVRQAREAVSLSEAATRMAWSQHLPRLDVDLSYSPVAYPEDLFPTTGDFRYNSSVGVTLQVPIFTGFRITADIERANADLDEAATRLREIEELALLDTRASKNQLQTADASYVATGGVVEQARRAVGIAQLRYTEGVSTQVELRDAQLQLDQAEVNRAVAARDLQVSRARVVLLPSLPAAAGTVASPTAASTSTVTPSGPAPIAGTTRQNSAAMPGAAAASQSSASPMTPGVAPTSGGAASGGPPAGTP